MGAEEGGWGEGSVCVRAKEIDGLGGRDGEKERGREANCKIERERGKEREEGREGGRG